MLTPPASLYLEHCQARSLRPNTAVLKLLADLASFDDLIELDLSKNYVGPNGFLPLIEVIRHSHNIKVINVSDNRITNECLEALVVALTEAAVNSPRCGVTSLQRLDISRNPISHAGGKRLVQWLKSLPKGDSGDDGGPPAIVLDNTLMTPALIMQVQEQITQQNWERKFGPTEEQKERTLLLLAQRQQQQEQAEKQRLKQEQEAEQQARENEQQQQQEQQGVELPDGKDKVVGETLDGEAMIGRDRGGACDLFAANFTAAVDSNNMNSRQNTANNYDNEAEQEAALGDDVAPEVRAVKANLPAVARSSQIETVPNCYVYVVHSNKTLHPWRSVTVEQDGGDKHPNVELATDHDCYVRKPNSFLPALPLSCFKPDAQKELLQDPESKKLWVPKIKLFHEDLTAQTEETTDSAGGDKSNNHSSNRRMPSKVRDLYDDSDDDLYHHGNVVPIPQKRRLVPAKREEPPRMHKRGVSDDDEDLYS